MAEKAKITIPPTPPKARSVQQSEVENFGVLGKRIEIGARAKINKNKPGYSIEFFVPTVDVVIGIGKDHVARLILDEDAWKALKKGQKINIDSLAKFQKNFIK